MMRLMPLAMLIAILPYTSSAQSDDFQILVSSVESAGQSGVAISFSSELSPARDPGLHNGVAGICLASVYAAARGLAFVTLSEDGKCDGKVEDGAARSKCSFSYALGHKASTKTMSYDAVEYARRCETGLLAETDLSRLH